MNPQSQTALMHLERDVPINGTPPMRWLDNHRADIMTLLSTEPIHILTECTGLNTATILRWSTQHKRDVPELKAGPEYADLAYWKGRAEGYKEALEMIVTRKGRVE